MPDDKLVINFTQPNSSMNKLFVERFDTDKKLQSYHPKKVDFNLLQSKTSIDPTVQESLPCLTKKVLDIPNTTKNYPHNIRTTVKLLHN